MKSNPLNSPQSLPDDNGLSRMKFWATLWLVAAALLFIASSLLTDIHPLFNFTRAFAEGSLVGGLADWFAVTALFSHPLGLPIPHTAIIPRRKDDIGVRLGNFIQTHFLRPHVVKTKLADMKITARVLDWLASEHGSRAAVAQAASLITWGLHSLEDEKIRQFLATHIVERLRTVPLAPLLGDLLFILTANSKHQELFDKGVAITSDLFEQYKPRLKEKMAEDASWWARLLQGIAFRKISKNVSHLLDEIKTDPQHEARQKFDAVIIKFIEDLRTSPELRQKFEGIKENLLQDPAVQIYLGQLWSDIKPIILAHCADPNSQARLALIQWVQTTTLALQREAAIVRKIERTFQLVAARAVRKYRHEVAHLITQEVERWDANTTSQLIERQIGKDLQWIRINGTLVGGLAGLLIYAASLALAGF